MIIDGSKPVVKELLDLRVVKIILKLSYTTKI